MKSIRGKAFELIVLIAYLVCSCILIIFAKGELYQWAYSFLLLPVFCFLLLLVIPRYKRFLKCIYWLSLLISLLVFWFNPKTVFFFSVNVYSITAASFLILNTILCIVAPKTQINPFFGIRTPVSSSYPEVWAKIHKTLSYVSAAFEVPLFLLIFVAEGLVKFWLSVACALLSVLAGAIIGQFSARPLIREIRRKEEEDLKKEIKKEQGYK